MERQETNKKASNFENLITLKNIWRGNELNTIVANIAKSKNMIENFCKNLKNHEQNLKQKAQTVVKAVEQPKTVEKVEVKVEPKVVEKVATPEKASRPVNTEFKKDFSRNKENTQFNKVQQKDGAPRFNRDRNDGNGRPMQNRDGKPFEKKGNFVPRDNNGFKPKQSSKPEIVETIVTKPERNFGNKNKTKTFDTEKKELSKKAKMKMGYIDYDDNYMDGEERMGRVRTKVKKAKVQVVPEKIVIEKAVIDTANLTVKILSEKIGKPAVEIIKQFMLLGMMLNINSVIAISMRI